MGNADAIRNPRVKAGETRHGRVTAAQIIDILAEETPGFMMRIRHPKAEGYFYVLLITKPEYLDLPEGASPDAHETAEALVDALRTEGARLNPGVGREARS